MRRFDGDGCAHACRFRDGRVTYCNRMLETPRLQQERSMGYPLFGKVGLAASRLPPVCACAKLAW